MVFPHLTELRLFPIGVGVLPRDLAGIIQNFLHFREGIITRLIIPPFRDGKVAKSLKKCWPCLEVRNLLSHNHAILILSQVLQFPPDVIARLTHSRLPGRRPRRKRR